MEKHNPSKWHEKIWKYYPIDYNPNYYHSLVSWWLDLVPKYGDKLMEIGPYSGLSVIWLKQNFPEKDIIAVDINEIVIHFARTRLFLFNMLDDIPLYKADALDLSTFSDKCKDVIFSSGLYEHFNSEDRKMMIIEHLRVAKYVIFAVPTKESLEKGGGYGDEIPMTKDEWIFWVNNNFRIVKSENHLDSYEVHSNEGEIAFVLEGVK